MRYLLTFGIAAAALLAPVGAAAEAQQGTSPRAARSPERSPERSQRDRAELEAQLQRRLAEIARRELELTDAQFAQLQQVNRRFEGERRELIVRERRARIALRQQLRPSGEADEARVRTLLDELLATQRDRLTLLEREQQALAGFLSPVQRARYLGLQEGFRRQVEQRRQGSRQERDERRGPPRPAGGRPPGTGGR